MPLVGGRIDMDVREDMIRSNANLHAGNLGSPEEVPVFINLEILVPANRLQNIAVGHEAIANECALGNVATSPILTAWNVKYST